VLAVGGIVFAVALVAWGIWMAVAR
jgi:hypothetical protein